MTIPAAELQKTRRGRHPDDPSRKYAVMKLTEEDLKAMGLAAPSPWEEESPEAGLKRLIRIRNRERALSQHVYASYQGTDGMWYTYFTREDGSRQKIKRRSELDLKEAIIQHYTLANGMSGFRTMFKLWIKEKMQYGELANSTYTKYLTIFKRYFKPDNPFCQIPICEVTERDLTDFLLDTLREDPMTRKAFSDLRSIMRSVFHFAKQQGYTDFEISRFFNDFTVPKRMIRRTEQKQDSEEVFDEQETAKLAKYLWENKSPANLALLLMFQTGMRVGEAASLKKKDIGENSIFIRRTETTYINWKTGERICETKEGAKTEAGDREVLIPQQAKITIAAAHMLNPKGEYLFMRNGKRVTTKQLNYWIHKACREVGIPERSTHKIRKTYASILVGNNLDSRLVMHQMGHTDITTTMKIYVKNRKKAADDLKLIQDTVNVGEREEIPAEAKDSHKTDYRTGHDASRENGHETRGRSL